MDQKPVDPDHRRIIERLRELIVASGGEPRDGGLEEVLTLTPQGTASGDVLELSFLYWAPSILYAKERAYFVTGGCIRPKITTFWELFLREFDVAIPDRFAASGFTLKEYIEKNSMFFLVIAPKGKTG